MPLENYAEPEVAVAAVVVGAAASPSLRNVVRRSLIYGLAGTMIAYDRTTDAVRGVVKGVRNGVGSLAKDAGAAAAEAAATVPPAPPPPA
jgi:hypothetical protein